LIFIGPPSGTCLKVKGVNFNYKGMQIPLLLKVGFALIELIYWTGAAIFGFATLFFSYLEVRRSGPIRGFHSNTLVCFITAFSYVVMALALGTVQADNGQPIYWTRWLFYIASCSILTLELSFITKKSSAMKAEIALFTGLTMFCGYLASVVTSVDRWWFFGFSTAAFMGMLYLLLKGSKSETVNLNSTIAFVVASWSLFPVIWILAPTGFGLFTTLIEALLYLALDFVTKIAFGFYITTRENPPSRT
jgi:sensory rhodopsin